MAKLSLTLACGDYDRTRALADGRIQPEGIDLNYLPLEPEETFWRMLRHLEFDAAEMSMSSYLIARARGNPPLIAIPVFPSRFFRHSSIYIHTGSGIARPEDLAGKRVGVPEYQITAVVWIRGILQHEYGVSPDRIEWYVGGEETPGRPEKLKIELPPSIRIHPLNETQTLNRMLESGEIDAVFSARSPSSFRAGSPRVARLFPDYRRVEADYYRRTGIFPIMHTVVLREELYRANPWVAQSLTKAFQQAKELCYRALSPTVAALPYGLPWLIADIEEAEALFGKDYWPYGLEPNRKTLEALTLYSWEQHLTPRRLEVEELFAPNSLDTFKI